MLGGGIVRTGGSRCWRRVYSRWRSISRSRASLAKYGSALTFDYHTREAYYVIESSLEQDVSNLVREFQLETAEAYFDRSRRDRAAALEKFEKSRITRSSR